MKYRVHYNVPKIVEFDLEDGQDLKDVALWSARHVSGADAQITHVLPAGVELEKDLPRKVVTELPPPPMPPMPPMGLGGDQMLARAA